MGMYCFEIHNRLICISLYNNRLRKARFNRWEIFLPVKFSIYAAAYPLILQLTASHIDMKNTLCYIIFQNQRGCGHEAVCGTDFPRKRRRSDHFPAHYAQHLFYVSAVQSCFPIAGGFFFRQMHGS